MQIFIGLIGFGLVIFCLAAIYALVLLIQQRSAEQGDVPPFDLIDAKKLNDRVAQQVAKAVRPLLESQNYSPAEIETLLKGSPPRSKLGQ